MKPLWVVAIILFALGSPGSAAPTATLRGYSVTESERERRIESQFVDIPSVQNALDTATILAAHPHYAGTPADYALAVLMRDRMRADGIPAELEPFSARVDTPRELVLELAPPAQPNSVPEQRKRHVHNAAFPVTLDLAEVGEPTDPATETQNIGLPFNAGSGDGDVSAPLVYADRGLNADYETLARAGVDARGAVVLIRYGAQFRGLLAERAQARGAAGVIFYSDPKDDGSTRGLVYPLGPWRPRTAVERGWVGDAIRIPTLPVSAANAQILLSALAGPAGPPSWGGTLAVAYPLARGPGRVHLIVRLNRKRTTLWNTVGVVAGANGDQSVILGAHRDAWVYGAGDNGAGVTTTLEVARGLGFLLQSGWRPERTIILGGWDGEEIGFAGSRAYAQQHHIEIMRGCFAYLNADHNVTGPRFGAAAAAVIAPILVDATRAVHDPLTPAQTLYDRWATQTPQIAPHAQIPGGGSDYESFLAAAGTPVGMLDFSGPFGVYHSSYDTLTYATHFSDPDFSLHRAAAQVYGVAILRLADARIVPYAFGGYAVLLRNALTHIATQQTMNGRPFDTARLARSLARFTRSAARFDRGSAGAVDNSDRELHAARELDMLAYGVSNYAGLQFSDIESAFAVNDAARVDAAIADASAALDRATTALTPSYPNR